jgi:hypothetical protein
MFALIHLGGSGKSAVKTAWLLEIHTLIGDLHIYQQEQQEDI